MKKLLAAIAIITAFWSVPAMAQCNGKFGSSTACGSVNGGPPGPIPWSAIVGNAITGLTGDGTATGPGTVIFTLATVNSNVGTFGSATLCTVVTANAKGLITAISTTTCTPAFSSLTGQATLAQLPQLSANSIYINTTASAAQPTNTAVPACANDGIHALVYINGTGLQCASLNTSGTLAVGTTAITGGNSHGVLTNNASVLGNPSPGSIGQFLGSNGAAEPTMQSGVWTLLATLTASNSATLSDTTHITSTYSEYEIEFVNLIPATNSVTAEVQVHSGGTFQATNYVSQSVDALSTTAGGQVGTAAINVSLTTNVFNGAPGLSGFVRVSNPSTSAIHQFYGTTNHAVTASTAGAYVATGYWNTAGVIDGFQFLFSTGNITSGTIKIYGRL